MNVLFLMIAFPDIRKDTNIHSDLAEEFRNKGHKVYVATILESKQGINTTLDDENGLNVLRIRTGDFFKTDKITKGITLLSLPRNFIKAIKKHISNMKFDLIIFPTPPITFAPVANYFKKKDGSFVYLVLRDIFPQNAVDLKMMPRGIVFDYFRSLEKKMYCISDKIGCMSKGNIDYVLKNNKVSSDKLEVLYNWKTIRKITKGEKSVKDNLGIKEELIALFGGNIGLPQGLEFLILLAEQYKDNSKIGFVIVGDGTEKGKIKRLAEQKNLKNVHFINQLNRMDYNQLLLETDIGLINLSEKFTIPNIPSKTLDYFDAGIPILGAVDENTDYKELIEGIGSGLVCKTGDLEVYKKNFETLIRDKELRIEMGKKGREFFLKHMTSEKAYEVIMNSYLNKE